MSSVTSRRACVSAENKLTDIQSFGHSAEVHLTQCCYLCTHLVSLPPRLLLPLRPPVNIIHDEWCWKNKSVEVEVLDSDVSGVEFRQIGYILRCSLSHAITLVSAPQLLRRRQYYCSTL